MSSLLSVSDLSLTLAGQQILKDISFSVKQGEVIGLIGPNGSGKTTLFNVLSGFFRPETGRILFHAEDITTLSPSKRAQRGIGRVFQNFGIFREMTIEENMLVALEALPREQRKALGDLDEKVRFALSLIGLHERKSDKASALSGGQMRLLEIARTLASGKELFLLDEPTAGVSPKMTGEVANLIKSLKEEGKTVLIIEHDLPFIARICDRVIVLDVGSIVLTGTPQEVQQSHRLKEIYFGMATAA
ncbi:MAG: ABC transporter ATP-binding protein [Patescibacteria group bacterium]